jgi:heavy metal sensor kinase
MFESVRVRLTLWYTAVLAIALVGLALATYFIFRQHTVQRTDSDLAQLSDAFLTTLQAELKDQAGPDAPKAAAEEAIIEHRFRDHVFAVLDPTGSLLISSQDLPTKSGTETVPAGLFNSDSFRILADPASRGDRVYGYVSGGRDGYRGFGRSFTIKGQAYTLVVLRSLHPQDEMLEEITTTFKWVIPLAILLASVGGYFLARKSLAPVVAMSNQAGRIGAANLHERLPIKNEKDELGHLASSFNQLLERVAESFERQRRFMSDASHELRTPVAILRGESEVALSRSERSPQEYRESLAVLHGEAQRLTHIVEDLFTLTRADAGQYPLAKQDFYLDELVADCAHSTRSLASARNITLTCATPEELLIHADEGLLRRMILNLLDNAIKYTQEGGSITVSCDRVGDQYTLSVSDTGPGIPAELQSRIFERFVRADKARTRSDSDRSGAGLGLAIARWIAEAHDGRLVLIGSDVKGSTFTAFLPVPVPETHSAAASLR